MRSATDKWDIPFKSTSKKRAAAVFLLEQGEASRMDLMNHAGLPGPTVTAVVQELAAAGFDVMREQRGHQVAYRVNHENSPEPHDAPLDNPAVGTVRTVVKKHVSALDRILGTVEYKGVDGEDVVVTWSNAPGVDFRGKPKDAGVPMALLSGAAPVFGVVKHPSGGVELDLGTMRVHGKV